MPDDLDGPEGDRLWIEFRDGAWRCPERDLPCGDLRLIDVALIDVDRDGTAELVAALSVNGGGTMTALRLLAWRWDSPSGRYAYLGDLAPAAHLCNDADWTSDLAAFGAHCIQASGECGKPCHGCDGTPCRAVYAWTGAGFAEALFDAEPLNEARRYRARRDEALLASCRDP